MAGGAPRLRRGDNGLVRAPSLAVLLCGLLLLSVAAPAVSPARRQATAAKRATTIWAVGDAENSARARVLAARVRRGRPDRLLYLGDVYEHGTAREFSQGYDALYGSLGRRTIPTPGNHEWGNRDVGYRPYWRAKLGRPMPDWHRHTLPDGWQVLSLNSEAPHGPGSPQARWLADAVRRPGTCRIAIWHRPRWSSGWHGDQADMATLWNGLRGRARLVLSGHDHDLQRFADRDGLRQIVSGGGGRPNVPIPRGSRGRLRFVNRITPGGARLTLSRGRATIEMVASSGRVLDRSVATCRPVA